MTNILVRGLSEATVQRIDAEAAALGLSRNEYLRRKLEGEAATSPSPEVSVTEADWQRSAATFGDLADPAVMDAAWH
ncbi:hypothetical protein [Granulicoccus phenolivorans]|uniref:type II toxin-antitoxin system VapB family antitoxin n=1 Tax=Granulicoccus phenolivorans TaxID=266854 RepID=UPI0004268D47|nr:hypothetical protein [Granulicoccus phenolivorans]